MSSFKWATQSAPTDAAQVRVAPETSLLLVESTSRKKQHKEKTHELFEDAEEHFRQPQE